MLLQVHKSHYFNRKYDSQERWSSYWYQIKEVTDKNPKNVLEIGVGNKTVSDYLKKLGIKVTTLDFDKSLNPDIVGNVLHLPFKQNSYDLILCAEVLEHLPFKNFDKAISQIYKTTNKHAVITLPHFSITNLYLGAKIIPFVPKIEISAKIDIPIKHKFLGEHYWEIGKKGFNLSKIHKSIEKVGFTIEKSFYPKENPRHQFFILSKW